MPARYNNVASSWHFISTYPCSLLVGYLYVLRSTAFFMTNQKAVDQGFSNGVPRHTSVPRNFWTVPREKVLGKCEHIKKGLYIKYYTNTIVISAL